MCISLFGISIKELLNGIGSSNYSERENLLKKINNTPTKIIKAPKDEIKASNDRLGDIENAPAKIEGDKEEYVTFGELPGDMILDVDTDHGDGVKCLIGKYRRYYSKIRKQSLIDLYLSKEGGAERLKKDIKEFCQQFKSNDDVKKFINGVKDENEKRSTSRIAVRWGVTIALLFIGFTALVSNFFVPIEIIIDNETRQLGELAATLCGILDFMLGIMFAWWEYKDDEKERSILKQIENALTEFNEVVPKVVGDVKGAASDVKGAASDVKGAASDVKMATKKAENITNAAENITNTAKSISDDYGKKIKEVEKVRESLKICEQCHVPLENDCNVCGHKNDPEMRRSIDTTDYIIRGKKSKKIENDSNPSNWTIKSCNWTIKECGEGCYTVIFNNENIVLKTEQDKMCNDQNGLTDAKYVKKIVFNEYVKTVRLKDDEDTTDYLNIRGIFPKVEIVAFAQPTPNKETGYIIRQYKLGKDIFKNLHKTVNVKGLEYIAKAEEGCFAGWDKEYCRLAGLNVDPKCFTNN